MMKNSMGASWGTMQFLAADRRRHMGHRGEQELAHTGTNLGTVTNLWFHACAFIPDAMVLLHGYTNSSAHVLQRASEYLNVSP